jgi:asparagine synthase (glutamine-hydrolysing)
MAYTQPSLYPSIEKRYPYLDRDLLEFLISIPVTQLLRPGERRSLMRRALVGIVPADVLLRKTKATASRRWIVALGKDWDRVVGAFKSPLSADLGYINGRLFYKVLLALKHGQMPPNLARLLKTISLELWLRSAVCHGVIAPPTRTPSFVSHEIAGPRSHVNHGERINVAVQGDAYVNNFLEGSETRSYFRTTFASE